MKPFILAYLFCILCCLPALLFSQTNSSEITTLVPASSRITDSETIFELAKIFSHQASKRDEALHLFQKILKQAPQDKKIYFEIAKIYQIQEKPLLAHALLQLILNPRFNWDQASKLINHKEVIQPPPPHEKPRENIENTIVPYTSRVSTFETELSLAKILSHQASTQQEALHLLRKLIRRSPSNKKIYFEIAKIYLSWQKNELALQFLNFVLNQSPDEAQVALLISLMDFSPPLKKTRANTVVSDEGLISNYEARFELAKIYSHHEETYALALREYRILLLQKPADAMVYLGMSRVFLLQKKYEMARQALCTALPLLNPQKAEMLAEAGDVEALYGHAHQSRLLYLRAMSVADNPQTLCIRYADVMKTWGDYYQAEKIYRDHLSHQKTDDDLEIWLKLANTYWNAKRYEEAEGIYHQLLVCHPTNPKILADLANLKLLENDIKEAKQIGDQLYALYPFKKEFVQLKAEIFFQEGCYQNAIDLFLTLIGSKKYQLNALIKIGRAYLKLHDYEEATPYFKKAFDLFPDSVQAQFYTKEASIVTSDLFIENILLQTSSPQRLRDWGNVFAENKYTHIASRFFAASITTDCNYLPGKFDLADMLAADRKFKESLDILERLNLEFQKSAKIMIRLARVLSWDKQYQQSIAIYNSMILLNPKDNLPRIELGRVAIWDLQLTTSMNSFGSLYKEGVDQKLYCSLEAIIKVWEEPKLQPLMAHLYQLVLKKSIYKGYEHFKAEFSVIKPFLEPSVQLVIDKVLASYYSLYRIQKFAYLESLGLLLNWQKRPLKAIEVFKKLLAFSPWNEEVLFTLAQTYCTINLCDYATKAYCKLLHQAPLHKLAQKALQRERLKNNPALANDYYFWKEQGRGGIDGIVKNRDALTLEVPLSCRARLRFIDYIWSEKALFNQQIITSNEQAIEGDAKFSSFLEGRAGFARKDYTSREFATRYTGFAHLGLNFCEGLFLDIGYDRTNELYNLFGYRQGIQADIWSITASADIHHQLNMRGWYRSYFYNDHNSLQEAQFISTYTFTERFAIFKVALWAQYRNMAENDLFIYQGDALVNVIHPYWTPQKYYCGGVTFEWKRDFNHIPFCGAQERFASLRVIVQTDTEDNPGFRVEGEIKHEFCDRWTIAMRGLVHTSPQWLAQGFWSTLKYRF